MPDAIEIIDICRLQFAEIKILLLGADIRNDTKQIQADSELSFCVGRRADWQSVVVDAQSS